MLEKFKKHKLAIIVTCGIIALLGGLSVIILSQDHNKPTEEVVQTNERNISVAQLEVANEYINIRAAKDINSTILGKVKRGEIYTIKSEDAKDPYHWYEIETTNGIKGFISGANNYVKILKVENENNTSTKPETTPNDNTTSTTQNNTQTKPNTNTGTKKPNTNKKPKPSKPSTNNSNTTTPNTDTNTTPTEPNMNTNTNTNVSSNNNDKPDTTNTETTQDTPTPVEKKVIDATILHQCPDGFNPIKGIYNTCARAVKTDNKPIAYCPSGYTLEENSCVKNNNKPDLNAKAVPICASGAEPVYATNGGWLCRDGSLVIPYRCPSGYKLIQQGSDYICRWPSNGTVETTNVRYKCSGEKEKPAYDENKNIVCYKTESSPKRKLVCPSGYTLNGEKCYEN